MTQRAIGDPNEVEFQRQQYIEGRDTAKLERALRGARAGHSLAAGEGALIVDYFEKELAAERSKTTLRSHVQIVGTMVPNTVSAFDPTNVPVTCTKCGGGCAANGLCYRCYPVSTSAAQMTPIDPRRPENYQTYLDIASGR
jgi:hypothetical protein